MEKSTTIGMDLGDKNHQLCVLDAAGEIVEQTSIVNTFRGLEKFFKGREPSVVAMEVGTHSPWISRALAQWGHEPLVGNARKLRAIWDSPKKDDERDAEILARIARFDRNLLYPVEHRGADAQADLAVVKARDILVKERTRLIAHTRNSVKSSGHRLSKCSPDCFHTRAPDELPRELYPALIGIIEVVGGLNQQIHNYDEQIRGLCEEHYPETKLLRQITGVGPVTALAYVLTLEEPGRFKNSRQVGPFLGLTRKTDQSGQTDRQLPISKAGDAYLRRLLVGAAHYILGPFGPPCRLRDHGEKIAARGGKNAKKRAVVAVARKLAVLLHHLWKTGQVYDPMYKKGAPMELSTAAHLPEPGGAPTPAAMDNSLQSGLTGSR